MPLKNNSHVLYNHNIKQSFREKRKQQEVDKKLSYCKQLACELRTQYLEGIYEHVYSPKNRQKK